MKRAIRAVVRRIGRGLVRVLGGAIVVGLEHVPRRGPVLFVPNHLSDLDPVIVGLMLPRDVWFMAKSELFGTPVLGPLIRYFGAFPVHRDSADRAAIRFAEERLAADEALVLFPEGRLSETGTMQAFQPGAALLALRARVPVIPIGLTGTPSMMPYGKVVPRRAPRPVRMRIGAPIALDDLYDRPRHEALEEATRRMSDAVRRLIDEDDPAARPPMAVAEE